MSKVKTINKVLSLDTFSASFSNVQFNPREKRGVALSQTEASNLLNGLMSECTRLQNSYLQYFSDPKYRKFILGLSTHQCKDDIDIFKSLDSIQYPDWKSQHKWTRACVEESVAKLKGYHQRQMIAEVLSQDPDLPYSELKKQLGSKYVKFNLYKNVRRAVKNGKELQVPNVARPRLGLGIVNFKMSLCEDGILLKNVHVQKYTLDLFFPVPPELFRKYPNLTKVGLPVIRISSSGRYVFDFLLTLQVKTPRLQPNFLGIDPKKSSGFAGAILYSDGNVSKEIKPSKETLRHQKKLDKLKLDTRQKQRRLNNKRQSYSSLSESERESKVEYLVDEIALVREKAKRVQEALDWSAANDAVHLAKTTNSVLCLEKVSFNDGDNHWRNSQFYSKAEHVAGANAVYFVGVPAKDTSRTCPKCDGALVPKKLSERTSHCPDCGETGDRDYFAAVVMAKKGRETAKKGHATPKQVNFQKSSRKKQIKKKVQEVRDKKSSMIKWAGKCWVSSALACYCAEYTASRRKSEMTNTAFSNEVQATRNRRSCQECLE